MWPRNSSPAATARIRPAKAGKIYDILLNIFALAEEKGMAPHEAADLYAEERIRKALEQSGCMFPVKKKPPGA